MLKFLVTLSFGFLLFVGYITRTHDVLAYELEKVAFVRHPVSLKMETVMNPPATMHAVKHGEWLSKIAKHHNTTVDAIVRANQGAYPSLAKNPDLIRMGWTLVIPTTNETASPENSVAQANQSVYPETVAQAAPRDKQVSSPPHTQKKHRAKSKKHPSGKSAQKSSDSGIVLRLERNLPLVKRIIDQYQTVIVDERKQHPVPSNIVLGMIFVESMGNHKAVSPKGARGAMQLMPATHAELGLTKRDAFHPEKNVRAGMRYLRGLYERLEQNEDAAIAAYERGEQGLRNAIARGTDPSQLDYVRKVKTAAEFFKEYRRQNT